MKLEIVLVLCCLALAHSLKIVNQNTAGTLACCGSGNTFDTTTQICCINTVFSIPSSSSNQQAACCGTSLLNNDQICCPANAGFVSTSDRAIANTLQCCGTKGYDPSTQLCCDNGSIVSSSSGALQCCGSRGYNPATDLCCGTSVISNGATNGQTCCGSAGFNSATQLCCFNKVVSNTNNNLQCCDATQFSTAFDPSTQTCCAGVVNTGASATCCGTRVFTPATQLCCAGNTIVSNPNANLECCGSSSYNPATQTCCSVTTETVSTGAKDCAGCKTITTTTSVQTQVGSIASSVGLCCGLTAYDSTINQCCSGRVNPLSTAAGTRTCCGTTTFNAAADLCCGSASSALPIVGGQSLANTECCGTSTFNTQTQTCQCGKQVAMTADIAFLGGEEACCGTTQYNNISATCCSSSFGNFLYPLEPAAGFKCCPQDGKSLYNPGYQICCDTKTVCSSTPAKLTIRDVEEVSFDFRALKGQFNPRDSHNFDSLLEKHAKATRDVEEIEEVEDLEKKKKKKKKKHSSGKSNKADSRDRTSGNIANNDKGKFPLVQCGDACCNGQGYFINYQKCCGTPYTGYNVIDVSNTDAASSPLACCGDNIYNTNHQSCCEEIKSVDSCNVATANYGIFDPAVQLCCTA